MKVTAVALSLWLIASASAAGHASKANPVEKVIQLLSDLQAKIVKEGEEAQRVYSEFAEWCDDRSKNLGFEIKTGKAQVADLTATIEKETADISAHGTQIDELASSIATDEADLKAATEIRAKEQSEFSKEEAEMVEVSDTLDRAIAILQREMSKGGASMMQVQNAGSLAKAFEIMVQAMAFSSADASKLTALVQSSQDPDDDSSLGAPDAAVYSGHSGGIIETLEGLLEKAHAKLSDARNQETASLHNFEMLKQSLEDAIKFANKDMAEAKAGSAACAEAKGAAEGDLAVTSKDLAEDVETLGSLHHNCMTKSEEFEAATKSRGEELAALAEAKKVISENTSGAASISYDLNQVSLLQTSRSVLSTEAGLANFEAVRFIRDLARKQKDPALAQLASRMASAIRFGAGNSDDPFAKVKGLISDMLERLEATAAADATHKAYCDKELSETNAKKDDKSAEVAKLSTKIDQMSARSASLKEEVAELQKQLADLASSQAEMDKLRQSEHSAYVSNRADTEQGLEGVKMGLKVLREYYASDGKAHQAADGAGGGIIGLLEVVESDFSKGLAEIITTEEGAAADYDRQTKENQIAKTMKSQDVTYKTQEFTKLDKAITEASSDREGVQNELDAVLEYFEKLKDMCIAKAEPYEERKRRREAEIAGLKEALQILEGEAVLLQRKTSLRKVRNLRSHSLA